MKFKSCSTTREKYELIKHMLESLETPSKVLSEWETKFLESVTDQFVNRGMISERQLEILESLYTEKTA